MNIAYPAILIATMFGAVSGLIIKTLPYSSPAVSAFRMTVPFLFFLPMMIRRGIAFGPKKFRKQLWAGSLLNAVRMVLYILAYKLTGLANAVVLVYLWPLFALFIDTKVRKEKINSKEIGLLLLALSGVILMNLGKGFSFSSRDVIGSISMIISACLYSVTVLIFKKALESHSEGEVIYFQNAMGGILSLPFLLIEMPAHSVTDFAFGVGFGLMIGVIGFILFFTAMKRIPVFQYGALTYIEVVYGVCLGIFFLGEEMSLIKGFGIILILTSSVLSRFIDQKKPASSEQKQALPLETGD